MKTPFIPCRVTSHQCRLLKSLGLIMAAIVSGPVSLWGNPPNSGATLENQWQKLPEVSIKPESGSMPSRIGQPAGSAIQAGATAGGNTWQQGSQTPQTVPVTFWLEFKSDNQTNFATLAGKTVSDQDPHDFSDDDHPDCYTPSAVVNLKPNQTYTLTMGGYSTYHASAILTPPSLNDIFASKSIANQPARIYSVYFLDPATLKWTKACPYQAPSWCTADDWSDFTCSFQIQVRPDLGARPVTKPRQRSASGDDQGDDAWTCEKPAIDASTAPGDGSAVAMSSSKLGDPSSTRFNWSVNMGRLWNGAGAGAISLDETRLSTNVYTPTMLNYVPPSDDTNELAVIMDLDDTNCISQISAPQAFATIDPLYGFALLSVTDLLNTASIVNKLTNSTPDPVSLFLWNSFTTNAQQVLLNTNSTLAQQQTNLLAELNRIMQGGSIYDSDRFAGISLSGRTRRPLLANPSGSALTRLNRFLMEQAYPAELGRLQSTKFEVGFYLPAYVGAPDALGFLTLLSSATPFVTWRIGLPDGAANQWQVQEIRNGATNATLLAFNPANSLWTLTRATGNDARIETRAIVTNNVNGTNFCTETQEVKNGAGTVSDRTVEVYQQFDWGYELVTVTTDPAGANLLTTFNFNPNTNDSAAGGKIASIVYPDGFWERREYSDVDWWDSPLEAPFGALVRVVQPWEDTPITAASPDCLVTDYGYSYGQPESYKLVKWHDPTGERSWYAVEDYTDLVTRADAGAAYEEAYTKSQDLCGNGDQITETRIVGCIGGYGEWQDTVSYSLYSQHLAGHVYSKTYDTVKRDSYDYEFGTWDPMALVFTPNLDPSIPVLGGHDVRQTIFHGTLFGQDWVYAGLSANPIAPIALDPFRSTMETRVIQGGNLVAKELYVYQGDYTGFAQLEQLIYQRDCLGHAITVQRNDPATHQSRVTYAADWTGTGAWPGDVKLAETDEDGTVYTYTYDSLKRLKIKTKQPASGQSAIVTALAYDAANRVLTNTVSAGSLSQTTKSHYDLAGRKKDQTDAAGLTTSYSYQNSGRQTTVTYSSGTTNVVNNYLDRRVASVTGNAVTNQFYSYTIDPAEGLSEDFSAPRNVTMIHVGSSNSLRWTATYTDKKYAVKHELKPAFNNTNALYRSYRTSGRGLGNQPSFVYVTPVAADGNRYPGNPEDNSPTPGFVTAYDYDYSGQRVAESRDIFVGEDCWDPASTGRITTWTNFYELDGSGNWFHVSEASTYPFDNDPTPSLVERTRERVTGFAANVISELQKFDADTNQTIIQVTVDLAAKKLTTTTSVAQSSLAAAQVVVNGLLQTESSTTVAQATAHYYDSLGRENFVRDPLGNLTGTTFDAVTGRVIARTNPQGLTTTLEYYPAGGTNAGLLKCQTGPTGRKTYYNYNGCGQVIQTWGDVPYPEQRDYNQFGDLATLTTYRNGNQWTGPSWPASPGTGDATHWYYDEATGLVTNKTDAAGQAVRFDYYDNGSPKSRFWARGASSTNVYDEARGELVRIDYSDGSSVAFSNADFPGLNRQAKPSVMIDATGTNYLTYDHAGRLLSTYCTNGLLAGITVTNHYDPVYGRDALKVFGPSWALTNSFGYAAFGRMATVSNGIYSATYGYWPNSDLLQTTTCKSNSTVALTTTQTWETGPRLRSIVNTAGGAAVTSHAYLYDWLDRRIQAALEDGSIWKYGYNDRDELLGAHRFWSDWSPVAGQQYGYDYDNIGNRLDEMTGGDANGRSLRTTLYGANNLNEYTCITNPGYASIIGAALATNGVTVNSGAADRKGEYFHNEITVANGSGPLWQTVAVNSGGCTTNAGCALPANNQTNTYDADGNLTFDGAWTYQWDCENRLAAMTMTNITGVADSNRLRLEFVYDYLGRRTAKTVKSWNGSAFATSAATLFVYDGWNLIAILHSDLSVQTSFLWGQDLSGTMDAAGGIGGLLAAFEIANDQTSNGHFTLFDGNGNVAGLINCGGSLSARYEYSPFGELLRATGPMAKTNPFQFSTKFRDSESGLVCYGYRYCNPTQGRWIGRDPIAEDGGANLYGFVDNTPATLFDPLGQFSIADQATASAYGTAIEVGAAVTASIILTKALNLSAAVAQEQAFLSDAIDNLDHLSDVAWKNVAMNGLLIYDAVRDSTRIDSKQTGNQRDTGLIGWSDEEVSAAARDPNRTSGERRRFQKEEKARNIRNHGKERGGKQ